jgi:hypothetical protein
VAGGGIAGEVRGDGEAVTVVVWSGRARGRGEDDHWAYWVG